MGEKMSIFRKNGKINKVKMVLVTHFIVTCIANNQQQRHPLVYLIVAARYDDDGTVDGNNGEKHETLTILKFINF